MKNKTFQFVGSIEAAAGVYRAWGIFIPPQILKQLPEKGRFRTKGTMNGVPFNLAVVNSKDLGKHFVISAPFMKTLKAKPGQPIEVKFELVSHEELEIPEELLISLEQDEEAAAIFNAFTVGLKRGLVHYVNSAKQVDTRIKRSLELLHKIKSGGLHVQKEAKNKGK